MLSEPNVQYTALYRPSRMTIVLVALFCIAIVYFYFLMMYQKTSMYFFFGLMFVPFVLGIVDTVLKKRLLPFGSLRDELAKRLKQLKTNWLIRESGRGIRNWQRIELGLPRTVADQSLKVKLSEIVIPDGLIEPERIRTSKPGSLFGCVIGVLFCGLLIWGVLLSRIPSTYLWLLVALLSWNIVQLILGLPSVHRSNKLPTLLRRIGRRRTLCLPIVVGPGWVKMRNTVFRADRDILLIRRTGFRMASSEINCMLAGPEARQRLTFSGVGDEDFQLLFGAWNVEDVRTEFIHSELS